MCFVFVNVIMIFMSQNVNAGPAVNMFDPWSDVAPDFSDCKTCQILNELNPQWLYSKEERKLMICFDPKDVAMQRRCIVFPNEINLEIKE